MLELRIHGVNNTPPHGMLEVAAEDAVKARGDALGSFWTLSPAALEHARSVPPTHHDHVPDDVEREAYSWGLMARNTPSLPVSAARTAVSALSRAGWLLLLPLGLANVAYWSRRLLGPGRYGRGARSVRVFALALTLLLVTAVTTVSLDVVGTQCFGPEGIVCPALPGWLGWLATYSWSERLVLLSLAPIAALGLLAWLAAGARVRYESAVAAPVPAQPARTTRRGLGGAAASSANEPPVLSRPGLWSRWVLARSMSNLHVAAGLALVTLTIAWSQVYGEIDSCRSPAHFFDDPRCLPGAGSALDDQRLFAATLVGSLVVLLLALGLTAAARVEVMPPAAGRTTSTASLVTLALAAAVFAVNSWATWYQGAEATSDPRGLTGLALVPGLLLVVLLVIALAGLAWRRRAVGWPWVGVAVLLVVALGWATLESGGEDAPGALRLGVAAVVVLVLLSANPFQRRRADAPPRSQQAWGGAAPGVFLLLSLGAAIAMAGLLVVVVGDWLNGAAPATCLVLDPAAQAVQAACEPATGDAGAVVPLTIPATYAEFGVATLVALVLVVLVVLGVLVAGRVRAWWVPAEEIPPAGTGAPEDVLRAAKDEDDAVPRPAGTLARLARRRDLESAVVGSRKVAAMLHRAEAAAGLVAGGVAVAVAFSLFVAVSSDSAGWLVPRGVTDAGLWAMAVLWGLVILRVVAAGDATGRPMGLIWDLVCFLPRSAHPFGPPCYAERAVPEIAARMDAWLRGDDLPTPAAKRTAAERRAVAQRRVVLSAHSLGAVLAVAALFTQDTVGGRPRRAGRVALVTYGAQLRVYFGRMFPEVLGPTVLGTPACARPLVLGKDPWRRQVAGASDGPLDAGRDTLVRRLGGREDRLPAWVSLWRRTDPLGFPLDSFGANPVDRGAEEIDATSYVASVAGHSGYPRTAAYRRALREVLARLDAG